MANCNCLEGFKCPCCDQEDEFRIAVQAWATVHDDGIDDYGDSEWDDYSACECPECGFAGHVIDFQKPEDKEREAGGKPEKAKAASPKQ